MCKFVVYSTQRNYNSNHHETKSGPSSNSTSFSSCTWAIFFYSSALLISRLSNRGAVKTIKPANREFFLLLSFEKFTENPSLNRRHLKQNERESFLFFHFHFDFWNILFSSVFHLSSQTTTVSALCKHKQWSGRQFGRIDSQSSVVGGKSFCSCNITAFFRLLRPINPTENTTFFLLFLRRSSKLIESSFPFFANFSLIGNFLSVVTS